MAAEAESESAASRRLAGLVEALTTAGGAQLDPRGMRELKRLCRAEPAQVGRAHRLLMAQLAAGHAEVRLAAFRALEQLFARSHAFRALVAAELPELLALAAGSEPRRPLPPPAAAARQLRAAARRALPDWSLLYGPALPQLAHACRFLALRKKVDFADASARTPAERGREQERRERLDGLRQEGARRAEREMEGAAGEMQAVLTELESCFRLLVPHPLDPAAEEQPCCSAHLPASQGPPPPPPPEEEDGAAFLQSCGLGSRHYALCLDIPTDVKLQENEDNTAIINSLMDAQKLIRNKFLPSVQSWIQLFTRAGISDNRLRKAIDLKNKLEAALEKQKEMNIDYKEKRRKVMKASDDSSDNEEFVEVPAKEGYEPHIPDHLRKEYGLEPVSPPNALGIKTAEEGEPQQNEEELDPTCAAATWKIVQDKLPRVQPTDTRNSEFVTSGEQNNKREEEKSKAPFVPFGLDLAYWGEEQPVAGKIFKVASQHRFWTPNEMEEEVENKDIAGMLKSRCITFAGKFEPVQHKCRAPMPNGGLCERQDRVKCPFHGKIIPRDELGNPVNQEDRDREAKEQFEKKEKQPEWQDPEFMREVETATGLDLGSSRYSGKGGKSKGKRKKYPNLTDLKQQADTAHSRLGKKVFDKTAMKRVAKAMNRIDQRKHEKFANQFNYALN
ncbi:UV-stimulated scaffold protein A isoform X1 [Eublepharis macularius]|uniref:UV-stimulated scaffold protein A n=1 Tax=Eublepharis macularius TaxID=481883 RepID=A0AA97J3B5_EUBMA|nr:UV-stimulated scaffold protein A isoform X1 [Eublepharis macularius]